MKGDESVGFYNGKDAAEFLLSCRPPTTWLDAARDIVEHVEVKTE